jgi:hypothetical protein
VSIQGEEPPRLPDGLWVSGLSSEREGDGVKMSPEQPNYDTAPTLTVGTPVIETHLNVGDYCRVLGRGTPARYIGHGLCAWVSAMTNDVLISQAGLEDDTAREWPCITDDECRVASAVLSYARRNP